MRQKKNETLELLKLFASYMVVFIHVLFAGKVGIAAQALARFAVPFFFLISGFYSYQIAPEKILKRAKSIASLLIFGILCYAASQLLPLLLTRNLEDVLLYFQKYTNLKRLSQFILFNVPFHGYYLWYLWAILYVYLIFYFISVRKIKETVVFPVSFILLLLHLFLGEILSIFDIAVPHRYMRNFALMGLPFFVLGLLANKYQDKLRKVSMPLILISLGIGIAETLFSRFAFGKNELYIGSLFMLFAFVCISLKYSECKFPPVFTTLAGCNTYIYILHVIVSNLLKKLYPGDVPVLHPILVCVVTTVLAYGVQKAPSLFQRTRNNKE